MALEQNILEQLIIDGSVGELTPEVRALLEAYLDKDTDAAALATSIQETIDFARQAMPMTGDQSLPEPRFKNIVPLPQVESVRPRSLRWVYGAAAAFAIGLLSGIEFSGKSKTAIETSEPPVSGERFASAPESTDRSVAAFWSRRDLERDFEARHRAPTAALLWNSPTTKPRPKGN